MGRAKYTRTPETRRTDDSRGMQNLLVSRVLRVSFALMSLVEIRERQRDACHSFERAGKTLETRTLSQGDLEIVLKKLQDGSQTVEQFSSNIHRYRDGFYFPAVGAIAWTGKQPFQGQLKKCRAIVSCHRK